MARAIRLSTLLVIVSQGLDAIGVGLPQSAGGFLVGLYLVVLMSALNFVFLLYVLGRTPGDPPAA